jgi:hypothetical protein
MVIMRIVRLGGVLAVILAVLALPATAGASSDFAATPTSHNFGNVIQGGTRFTSVTVTLDPGYFVDTSSPIGNGFFVSDTSGTCDLRSGPQVHELDGSFSGPGTCTVIVGFDPLAPGVVTGTFTLDECLGYSEVAAGLIVAGCSSSISVALRGAGISVFNVNPPKVDYGIVVAGKTRTATVTVTLDGHDFVDTSSPLGNGFFVPGTGTCGLASGPAEHELDGSFVGPGDCTMDVSFNPHTPGYQAAVLSLRECYGYSQTGVLVTPVGCSSSISVPLSGLSIGLILLGHHLT